MDRSAAGHTRRPPLKYCSYELNDRDHSLRSIHPSK
jgi:hypothetical protein